MQTLENICELQEAVHESKALLITIDGYYGAGKSTVAQELYQLTGGTLLPEKQFYFFDKDNFFRVRLGQLKDAIKKAAGGKPVIYESCFMEETLTQIGVEPSLRVYIKHISSDGTWNDFDTVDEEPTKQLALVKEKSIVPGFDVPSTTLQMIEYHYDYKPHENADIIYLNRHD